MTSGGYGRRLSPEDQASFDALVIKRIAEGLTFRDIGKRLGVSRDVIERTWQKYRQKGENAMAFRSKDEGKMTVDEALELLREAIRTKVKSGMQTHTAQDNVVELLAAVDEVEGALTKGRGFGKLTGD